MRETTINVSFMLRVCLYDMLLRVNLCSLWWLILSMQFNFSFSLPLAFFLFLAFFTCGIWFHFGLSNCFPYRVELVLAFYYITLLSFFIIIFRRRSGLFPLFYSTLLCHGILLEIIDFIVSTIYKILHKIHEFITAHTTSFTFIRNNFKIATVKYLIALIGSVITQRTNMCTITSGQTK